MDWATGIKLSTKCVNLRNIFAFAFCVLRKTKKKNNNNNYKQKWNEI